MKRSEINTIMRSANEFISLRGFYLPPFAYWSPADWASKGNEVREIIECRLGWDITDFGKGDFIRFGLVLFTIRNGSPEHRKTKTGKQYAEKIMIVEVGQKTSMHFHLIKMEDIINRGGGRLMIQLYNATPDEGLDKARSVLLSVDGVSRSFKPGEVLELKPGESVSLPQRCYHQFWADGERVLVGEVSLVNDDFTDNRRLEPIGERFPTVEEDVPPLYLLCSDYERYFKSF